MAFDAEKSRESDKGKAYEDTVNLSTLIQMTMEIQKTIGELSGKVDALGDSLADLRGEANKRLRPLERTLWGVAGAVVVFGVIAWILSPFLNALATKLIS